MIIQIHKTGLFLILLLVAISCTTNKDEVATGLYEIYCDAEIKIDTLGLAQFVCKGDYFINGAAYQSDEMARSGKYSVKLGADAKYSLSYRLFDLQPGMYIKASVWRLGSSGNLALTSADGLNFQKYSGDAVKREASGWEQILLEAIIPMDYKGQEMKLFVMNPTENITYYDDLLIEVFESKIYADKVNLDRSKKIIQAEINCDAELISDSQEKKQFISKEMLMLNGAVYQSDEMARSGNYSAKVGGNANYTFTYKFKDLKPDMYIEASVWRYGPAGSLALTSLGELKFQKYSSHVVKKDSSGWELISLRANVPPNYNGQELKFFVMNLTEHITYYDDLLIEVFETKPYPEYSDVDNIDLIIDPEIIEEINMNRIKSFERGVISKKTKKNYPAIFKYAGKEYEAEVRIKGDWLDHIQGNKWSFRIKLEEGNFKGMKEFSVQQPGSRGYINEYMIHQIFIEEDVLTTRYGFVPVKINGEGRGIYAYEEHFAKHLVESRNRREGPIMKFDEKGLWEINQKNIGKKTNYLDAPYVESSLINPFKKSKTIKNPVLKENFIIGQNLLNQYRYDSSPVSELFKLESLASFYALMNITGSWHAFRWHNERYYYDPVSSKLEIIAYDCFTEKVGKRKIWLTPDVIELDNNYNYDQYLAYSPFNDRVFYEKYVEVLDYYVNSTRLEDIFKKYDEEITNYYDLIKREYINYEFDGGFILSGADELKKEWAEVKTRLDQNKRKVNLIIDRYDYDVDKPLDGIGLVLFDEGPNSIKAQNFHSKELYIVAYSSKNFPEQGILKLKKEIKLEAYRDLAGLKDYSIDFPIRPSKIFYKTNLSDSIVYDMKVNSWPAPALSSPRQSLLKNCDLTSFSFIDLIDSTLIIRKGAHSVKEALVIPQGMNVLIEEGTELDFTEKAFFMSFSPISAIADPENVIRIISSDNSAMGFTIIDAGSISTFDNVIFDGFNTLSYKGWNLTGAVTFYQSDININNTQFLNNVCEDGLNIIRSDFEVKNSKISNAFSDGFDADFAKGIVESCEFERIGNDGIDFSGSEITIRDVRIEKAGDKGVSGGEGSTLYLENIIIDDTNIGVASKDRSIVHVDGVKIINSYCAFAVYQKKMEYDPAQLHVKNAVLENIGRDDLIGKGSILNIDGKQRNGTENIDLDSLYNL